MNFASLDTFAGLIGNIMFALFKPPLRRVNRGNVVYAPRGPRNYMCQGHNRPLCGRVRKHIQ